MRKRLIVPDSKSHPESPHIWLDLEKVATVEVASEAEGYPIEEALVSDGQRGWRANEPGPQTIRLVFDHPLTIRLIRVVFKEETSPRTQEFVLRWMPYGTGAWKEVVRQQWNFSPPNTVDECEEYKVTLESAAAIQLTINPDISQIGTLASLEKLQLSVQG